MALAEKIIDDLSKFLPVKNGMVALHEPKFNGNELKYVSDCVNTGWVSSVGSYVDKFEADLANYVGAKKAISAVNGTAALHLCLYMAGVRAGDEVLIPNLTFVATANAVSYLGAIPHLIDAETEYLGIDIPKLDEYLSKIDRSKIKAIVPMHTFGHPIDMDGINALAQKYGFAVVEDAAESLGSLYKGKHCGTLAQMSAISFNGNKTITTGGGGAIVTNDEELGRKIKHISTTARVVENFEYSHDEVGFNYRMPNINAALGVAQLEVLPEFIAKKRKLAAKYEEIFTNIEGTKFIKEPSFATSNYWLVAVMIDDEAKRLEILNKTNAANIMTRPIWRLMSELEMYKKCPKMNLENSYYLTKRVINIPSSPFLADYC